MSLRNLPEAKALTRPDAYQVEVPSNVLEKWAAKPLAAEADDGAVISVYDVIGEDYWSGEGVTAKRIAGALRRIGPEAVTVNINSPGGDMFEGLAIYNLLREHPALVRVKVMGLAASAASIIAMAGDEIEMGLGSFLMIHNAWGLLIGNRHDMRAAADMFDEFDGAMADIYVARSGESAEEVAALMDAETWMRAAEAVDRGFADGTFEGPDPAPDENNGGTHARRQMDALLAKQGVPRSERRRLIREATGTQDAAGMTTPGAGLDTGALTRLLATLKS